MVPAGGTLWEGSGVVALLEEECHRAGGCFEVSKDCTILCVRCVHVSVYLCVHVRVCVCVCPCLLLVDPDVNSQLGGGNAHL